MPIISFIYAPLLKLRSPTILSTPVAPSTRLSFLDSLNASWTSALLLRHFIGSRCSVCSNPLPPPLQNFIFVYCVCFSIVRVCPVLPSSPRFTHPHPPIPYSLDLIHTYVYRRRRRRRAAFPYMSSLEHIVSCLRFAIPFTIPPSHCDTQSGHYLIPHKTSLRDNLSVRASHILYRSIFFCFLFSILSISPIALLYLTPKSFAFRTNITQKWLCEILIMTMCPFLGFYSNFRTTTIDRNHQN